MAIAKSERLTVLSDAEQEALYGLPDFDDAQRLEYLALTENELALASNCACTKGKKDQTDNNVNVHALSFFTE